MADPSITSYICLFSLNPIFTFIKFDPDEYAAVIIKFKPASDMKQVTISIFGTGSDIITGAETLKEIVFAYNIFNKFIDLHRDSIKVTHTPRANTNQFDYICGYKICDLIKYLERKGVQSWFDATTNEPIKL